ncbi:PREDICTED: LOW QUALITY PROTEIN: ATP-binding cassette sub-family A member 3-like [Priapulus caudatus]|uniref:LOW QUALITY PROTEIN: ATP-binding cassette sub-family A member 3-like n=1 Tax=Priapulus caudatus TaxID=37621 RepID=A0ABM1EVW1_PRICU|nr:PREDICTED: LOW QUALITY PROTEIN: ATP-binding cassette sub-family A member 3-like [Priapulus caudatus]
MAESSLHHSITRDDVFYSLWFAGTGVQWSNVAEPVSVDDSFTLLYVMLMMLVDSVIFWLLTWYIEAVFPGEFGVPQPWYFPFMPSYWCGTRQLDAADDDLRQPLLGNSSHGGKMFEAEPSGLRVGIQMCQLRKITVLLGHNGAGKTTTMSMLTGLYPPTSGTAQVNGFDVRSDVRSVRSSMGLCLQHDVLFDTLTVEEHSSFFSEDINVYYYEMAQGCPRLTFRPSSHMVESMGLEDKRTALSRTLSGGHEEELSVGNALVGSKIVILDEPTSGMDSDVGMDPVARRATWDLLLAERRGRTMLLTTHHMDEADLLGDRIAIMAAGELRCCGGSLFLKKRYGAGYHMTIVKDAHCDAHQVASLVRSYVPSAEMESNSGAELSFVLPSESVGSFSELFDRLDAGREKLGVCSYGASVTTMEEVFLKVGEGMDMNLKSVMRTEYNTMTRCSIDLDVVPSSSEDHMKLNGGARLYAQQFLAMFLKRALHTARAWKVIVAQLLVPCVFTAITLVVVRTLPQLRDSPSLALTLAPFGQTIVPYYVPPGGAAGLAREFAAQFDGTRARTVDVSGGGGGGAATLDEYIVRETNADVGRFLSHCIVAAMFGGGGGGRAETTAYFNNQPYHASAISLGVADNALLRLFVNDSYSVTTVNHPLPRSAEAQINDVLTKNVEGFSISFNMMFGMAFLTSSFVLFLVKERESKAKHIQFISGVYSSNFWLSTFIWDFINFSIPLVCILFIFLAFNVPAYVEDEHLAYVLLLLVLYGWAMLPFVYIWSFCFSVPSTAFARLTKFNIISGIVTVLAVAILSIPSLNLEWLAVNLEWAFLVLLPNYCLGQAVQDLYNNYQFNSICDQPFVDYICEFTNMTMACCPGHCGGNCVQYTSNYLAWEKPGLGRPICFMAAQGAVFFVLLFLVEARVFRRMLYLVKKPGSVSSMQQDDSGSRVPEDDDVAEERRHVTATPLDSLFSTNMLNPQLSKNYGPLVAVDELTFAVPQGECFGLLGMNGAGKTSTFKMVTGDESISSGDAYVARYSIKTNIKNVQQNIGYCPQFDALIDHLTGRETLYMFARLRGVPEWQIPSMARYLLRALLLDLYADSYVGEYSGGTKRKLSTAVALVGDPAIVFLDEPTTGMDPVARRMLWDALSRYRVKGKCIVLTSHSMDECEALCTRIGIMVNGQLKCLGTQQHLKTKFGQGYTVLAKMAAGSAAHAEAGAAPNTQPLVQHLQQKYKGKCILKDVHLGFVHFHITDMSLKLSDIFATMEHAKAEYHLDDYSVSQTTLEQVFLNFAKAQRTEDEIAT